MFCLLNDDRLAHDDAHDDDVAGCVEDAVSELCVCVCRMVCE